MAFENSRINIYTLDIISQNKLFRKDYVYNIFQNLTVFNSKISCISTTVFAYSSHGCVQKNIFRANFSGENSYYFVHELYIL